MVLRTGCQPVGDSESRLASRILRVDSDRGWTQPVARPAICPRRQPPIKHQIHGKFSYYHGYYSCVYTQYTKFTFRHPCVHTALYVYTQIKVYLCTHTQLYSSCRFVCTHSFVYSSKRVRPYYIVISETVSRFTVPMISFNCIL